MAGSQRAKNLTELLSTLEEVGNGNGQVSVRDIREHLGARSFGPFLLAVGLIGSTPASGIPGLPTIIGITVLLTAGQLVMGRHQIWLPDALLRRSLDRKRLRKGLRWLKRPAGFIDRVVRPRLFWLTYPPFSRLLGICCLAIAFIKPPLELVPATSAIPAAVIAIFGLALTTHDGLVAIIALAAFAALGVGLFELGSALMS